MWDTAFFHHLAYISAESGQIFVKILSQLYPWTKNDALKFEWRVWRCRHILVVRHMQCLTGYVLSSLYHRQHRVTWGRCCLVSSAVCALCVCPVPVIKVLAISQLPSDMHSEVATPLEYVISLCVCLLNQVYLGLWIFRKFNISGNFSKSLEVITSIIFIGIRLYS